MFLEIITPEKTLFSGDINYIRLPGSLGIFEVLKNHAPLISTLDAGQIKVRKQEGGEELFNVNSGFVEVLNNKMIVLV